MSTILDHRSHFSCLGEHCDDHKSACTIHVDREHAHGKCEEPEHCDHHPMCTNGTVSHNYQCCCKTTDCITNFMAGMNTTPSAHPDDIDCLGHHCHQACTIHVDREHAHGKCEEPEVAKPWKRHSISKSSNERLQKRLAVSYYYFSTVTITQCVLTEQSPTIINVVVRLQIASPTSWQHCQNEFWGCVDHHGNLANHHECCCMDKNCVDTVLAATMTTTTSTTNAPATTVPATKVPTTKVPTIKPLATTNVPTVQTTTDIPLYCPVCADDFKADCQSNSRCKANEGCMLQVIGGKLKTGCVEISDCQYHERIGDSICCEDKNCTDVAFRNMHTMAYTCPSCQNSADPKSCLATQGKCSYLSKGCMITQTRAGISSGCNTHSKACQLAAASNSVLCNVHPIPFAFQPGLQCNFCCHRNESTCILDALGIHDVSTVPPTLAHTAGTTAPTCFDIEDPTFNCKSFDTTYHLCAQTSGLMAQLAVTKCRKTCGICGGIHAIFFMKTKANSVLNTTTPLPCIDHDINNNCVIMSSVLCASQNTHAKNYAIANCAKTCNLCKEYHLDLEYTKECS
ncbi:uncharacterized protein LOC132550114 [Ylistrum balloti]|uniref:uncharacterized protein LOC132550114 n=1 Tax=Ylistrum balloti TaxID=509963 RepID=UPI002905C606|nr:uncharacterized protein LOC132550114 [Ylistrum balloti]